MLLNEQALGEGRALLDAAALRAMYVASVGFCSQFHWASRERSWAEGAQQAGLLRA